MSAHTATPHLDEAQKTIELARSKNAHRIADQTKSGALYRISMAMQEAALVAVSLERERRGEDDVLLISAVAYGIGDVAASYIAAHTIKYGATVDVAKAGLAALLDSAARRATANIEAIFAGNQADFTTMKYPNPPKPGQG